MCSCSLKAPPCPGSGRFPLQCHRHSLLKDAGPSLEQGSENLDPTLLGTAFHIWTPGYCLVQPQGGTRDAEPCRELSPPSSPRLAS